MQAQLPERMPYHRRDTGTHQALQAASEFVSAVQNRQGLRIACLEEIAFRHGFIDADALAAAARRHAGSDYGGYLQRLVDAEPGQAADQALLP